MAREIVDLKTIAQRLKYSVKYLQNDWPRLLPGIRPLKLKANCRKSLFYWDDIEKLLIKEK
ncbi:MAG: hypothetical protein WC357_02890 [Candidatus Omnitrophota bacterium]|jgi:hypothetical protein